MGPLLINLAMERLLTLTGKWSAVDDDESKSATERDAFKALVIAGLVEVEAQFEISAGPPVSHSLTGQLIFSGRKDDELLRTAIDGYLPAQWFDESGKTRQAGIIQTTMTRCRLTSDGEQAKYEIENGSPLSVAPAKSFCRVTEIDDAAPDLQTENVKRRQDCDTRTNHLPDEAASPNNEIKVSTENKPAKAKGMRREDETVNDAMHRISNQKKDACIVWTQREWAEKLGCSPGAIGKSAMWKVILIQRESSRQNRRVRE